MGIIDNLEDKAKDAMNDPEKKEHIEQLAREKGISLEEAAKEHVHQHQTNE